MIFSHNEIYLHFYLVLTSHKGIDPAVIAEEMTSTVDDKAFLNNKIFIIGNNLEIDYFKVLYTYFLKELLIF